MEGIWHRLLIFFRQWYPVYQGEQNDRQQRRQKDGVGKENEKQ